MKHFDTTKNLGPQQGSYLPRFVIGVDLDSCDESALRELLRKTRIAQRSLDGVITQICARVNKLAEIGQSSSSYEVLLDIGQVSSSAARRDSNRASVINQVPELQEALIEGRTSGEHIDVISRTFSKLSDEEKQSFNIAQVAKNACSLPVDFFDKNIKKMVSNLKKDSLLRDHKAKRKASEFKHWFDAGSGMGKFYGQLDPERYEALTKAIDRHANTLASKSGPTANTKDANLAAQSLFDLVTSSRAQSQNIAHVTVIVDQETLKNGHHANSIAETEMGEHLPVESIARLCCDATLQKVTLDSQNLPINVGRKHRTATKTQWAAIGALYKSCSWDKCDRRLSWCQLHHIKEWDNGGLTDLDNLVPLCSEHHHKVHEGKWSIKLKPDRCLEIFKPDGHLYVKVGPPNRKEGACEPKSLLVDDCLIKSKPQLEQVVCTS